MKCRNCEKEFEEWQSDNKLTCSKECSAGFIAKEIPLLEWTVAKSYSNIPHRYAVERKNPEKIEVLRFFTEYIEKHGYDKAFYRKTFKYVDFLDVTDGLLYCYWTDAANGDVLLINRAVKGQNA